MIDLKSEQTIIDSASDLKSEKQIGDAPSSSFSSCSSSPSSDSRKRLSPRCLHSGSGIDIYNLSLQISKLPHLQCQPCAQANKKKSNGIHLLKHLKKIALENGDEAGSSAADSNGTSQNSDCKTWICLACAHVGCGQIHISEQRMEMGTGHAWKHSLYSHHPYVLQLPLQRIENGRRKGRAFSCWCFSCRSLLDFHFVEADSASDNGKQKGGEGKKQRFLMVGSSASSTLLRALRIVEERLMKEYAKSLSIPITLSDVMVEDEKDMEVKENGRIESRPLVKGLVNLGNTCFFNSVLQNLMALRIVRHHFGVPAKAPEGPLTASFRKLYVEITSSDAGNGKLVNGIVNPGPLFGVICDRVPRFRGFQQQDSHELLRFFLECLKMEELKQQKNRKAKEQGGETFVDSIFRSELSSTICCCECGHSSVVHESYLDLSLPIPFSHKQAKSSDFCPAKVSSQTEIAPKDIDTKDSVCDSDSAEKAKEGSTEETDKNGCCLLESPHREKFPEKVVPVSLEDCLAAFTGPEVLCNDNAWKCEHCASHASKGPDASILEQRNDTKSCQNLDSLTTKDSLQGSTVNDSTTTKKASRESPSETSSSGTEKGKPKGMSLFSFNGFRNSDNDVYSYILSSLWEKKAKETADKKSKETSSGTMHNATKVMLISKAPPILTVHLKRFTVDMAGRARKLSEYVQFHQRLDLRPFLDARCQNKENCIYELVGVVEHSGTMAGGHYVAYVRGHHSEDDLKGDSNVRGSTNTWYRISDTYVREVSFSEVLQSEAYLLFYEKDESYG